MIRVRPSAARGHFDHGWLDTYHTFSFGDYFDREHMGFRSLRVLNEDRVAPGTGFGKHGHRDMEILTLVLEGELRHQDSMGNGSVDQARARATDVGGDRSVAQRGERIGRQARPSDPDLDPS